MNLTQNIIQGFCEEQKWGFYSHATSKFRMYSGLRLYYPGCELSPNYLYVADKSISVSHRDKALTDICLITDAPRASDGFACSIITERNLLSVFSDLQALHERLLEWDRKLSNLLLTGASLQEILDCSSSILRNPCIFEDAQFRVLASYGEATQEESELFSETLKTGRAPSRLFEKIFSLSPQKRVPYITTNTVVVTRDFSPYEELLASCMLNGTIVLRFFLLCRNTSSTGIRDIVIHLTRKLESSSQIEKYYSASSGSMDALFSRIIDAPTSPDCTSAINALDINSYRMFSVVCMYFRGQTSHPATLLSRLRLLLPDTFLFIYNSSAFALLATNEKPGSSLSELRRLESLLFAHLEQMDAIYGVSLHFSDIRNLCHACNQAHFALDAQLHLQSADTTSPESVQPQFYYEHVLPLHILKTFFDQYDFAAYCPPNFLKMINDDRSSGTNNLLLLYTYLSNECNATVSAKVLYMHRNNVIYRINKIQEKYNFNLKSVAERQFLSFLCLIASYQ